MSKQFLKNIICLQDSTVIRFASLRLMFSIWAQLCSLLSVSKYTKLSANVCNNHQIRCDYKRIIKRNYKSWTLSDFVILSLEVHTSETLTLTNKTSKGCRFPTMTKGTGFVTRLWLGWRNFAAAGFWSYILCLFGDRSPGLQLLLCVDADVSTLIPIKLSFFGEVIQTHAN